MSFRFKQFFVEDSQCAMKVGTDGVLLGAWACSNLSHVNILDIGTGSGLIALMMAQRFPAATITAIDIDESATRQAETNFLNSPWNDRMHAQYISLQEFTLKQAHDSRPDTYDLIVCNPPFFNNSLRNPDLQKAQARHTDTLSYDILVQCSAQLLAATGILALILPAEAETDIIRIAEGNNLELARLTQVYSKKGKSPKRILCEFRKQATTAAAAAVTDSLYIESETSPRSPEYAELTKEFYL